MSETKKTILFMMRTVWKNKPVVFFIYLLMLINTVLSKVLIIFFPKIFIDDMIVILSEPAKGKSLYRIIFYGGAFIFSVFVTNTINSMCKCRKNVYKEWFDEHFEIMLAEQVMQMEYQDIEKAKMQNRLAKARDGISWYSGGAIGILDAIYNMADNIFILGTVSFVIIFSCPALVPVQLISIALILFFNSRINGLKLEAFKHLSSLNRICQYIFYQLSDVKYGKEIRLYDSAHMMEEKSIQYEDKIINDWQRLGDKQFKNGVVIDIINTWRDGVTYFYIGYLALKMIITVGDFSMLTASATTLYQSLSGMASGMQEITKKCSYAYWFICFLENSKNVEEDSNGVKAVSDGAHEIEFRHVGFHYPESDDYVLRNVNIVIRQGESLSIVGANGAGKTTFIKLLCRLYDVSEGCILLDGQDIREYSIDEYRELLAVIFQDFKLFSFSIKDNITAGSDADGAEIADVLGRVGLYEDVKKLRYGVNTCLHKDFDNYGTELSGGQRQKLAVCRALYKKTSIIILDEPASALDPYAEYELYRDFDMLADGKTVIYISHRMSSCRLADNIAVLSDGTIKEYGKHEQLLSIENGLYAQMYSTQMAYYE